MKGWDDLRAELDAWSETGRAAEFWWRDDDAVAPGPALDRLAGLAGDAGAPLALAVIPAGATPDLAAWLAERLHVSVLQHGFDHANRAMPGQKKTEYPRTRPAAEARAAIAAGRDRLRGLFADRALPIFVPPWNRIAEDVARDLPGLGLPVLSTFRPRPPRARGRLNTHVDPIAWRAGRAFAGDAAVLAALTGHLRDRRRGATGVDPTEPTGLLTHHLVTDAPGWAFLARLGQTLAAHPAARWSGPADWMRAS